MRITKVGEKVLSNLANEKPIYHTFTFTVRGHKYANPLLSAEASCVLIQFFSEKAVLLYFHYNDNMEMPFPSDLQCLRLKTP